MRPTGCCLQIYLMNQRRRRRRRIFGFRLYVFPHKNLCPLMVMRIWILEKKNYLFLSYEWLRCIGTWFFIDENLWNDEFVARPIQHPSPPFKVIFILTTSSLEKWISCCEGKKQLIFLHNVKSNLQEKKKIESWRWFIYPCLNNAICAWGVKHV